MKKTILLVAIFLFSAPSFSNNVTENGKNTPYLSQLSDELNITNEQRILINEFYQEYRTRMEKVPFNLLISIREQQFELLTESELNTEELSIFIDKIHQYEKTMVLEEMKLKNTVFNILDENQKENLGRIFYRDLLNAQRKFQ